MRVSYWLHILQYRMWTGGVLYTQTHTHTYPDTTVDTITPTEISQRSSCKESFLLRHSNDQQVFLFCNAITPIQFVVNQFGAYKEKNQKYSKWIQVIIEIFEFLSRFNTKKTEKRRFCGEISGNSRYFSHFCVLSRQKTAESQDSPHFAHSRRINHIKTNIFVFYREIFFTILLIRVKKKTKKLCNFRCFVYFYEKLHLSSYLTIKTMIMSKKDYFGNSAHFHAKSTETPILLCESALNFTKKNSVKTRRIVKTVQKSHKKWHKTQPSLIIFHLFASTNR